MDKMEGCHAASTAVSSRLPMFVVSVECITRAGSAGPISTSARSAGDCASPNASGSTSTWETSMSAGSGRASGSRWAATADSCCMRPMSLVSAIFLRTDWLMNSSGEYHCSTGPYTVATILHAAIPYTSTTTPIRKTSLIPSRRERQWCCAGTGVIRPEGSEQVEPNSLRRLCERSGGVMPKGESLRISWLRSMAWVSQGSVLSSYGRRGRTWSES